MSSISFWGCVWPQFMNLVGSDGAQGPRGVRRSGLPVEGRYNVPSPAQHSQAKFGRTIN